MEVGREILEVLAQFGGGGGADPGNNAVRFLLAAFFWAVLAFVSGNQYRRSEKSRDLYICVAALVGLSREFVMFFLEYGAFRGFVPVILSYRTFPPLEHALTDLGRSLLGFAYLNYFLADKRHGKWLGAAGAAFFVSLYLATAWSWVSFLDANKDLFSGVGVDFAHFWGDMAYRVAGSLMLGAVLYLLATERLKGRRVPGMVFLAFAFLFLDEFLMVVNIELGFDEYKHIFSPLRHNLGIWAIPFLLAGYWQELFSSLADSKAKMEGILEAIGDPIVIRSAEGEVEYRNSAHKALMGDNAAYPDPRGKCPTLVPSVAGEIAVECSTFSLRDAEGEETGTISILRDVTEARKMEEELRASEERYRSLVDNIDLGITLIDSNYRVRMVNRKQEDIFKVTPGYFTGRLCHEAFEKRGQVCPHCPGTQAMATGKPVMVELDNEMPDEGLQNFRIQAFPVTDGDGAKGFIEVVENITEMKRGREERERLAERLMQNQKLESLGILAGGIAHDFNNLLMGLVGNVDLALSRTTPESPVRPYLQRIDTTAQRAADLTNQMLAYSGKGRFVVEPINLSRLVEEMGHLLETVVNKNAVVKYRLAPDLPLIDADATQIRQVVMNLITNASDAIGSRSGAISVTTGLVEADAAYFTAMHLPHEAEEGFYAYLEVADTGCGMDRETQEKIFDPFFTTKYTGRGLGLAAVLGIVRGHRGALKVYSEPGRGTTFKVLFPVRANAGVESGGEALHAAGLYADPGPVRTILIVDDDETVLANTKMLLEECGYRVLTADDGEEGVRVFTERSGELSAVILDLTMPRMDGDEAFRRMSAHAPSIPVIMSSGYSELDAATRFAGRKIAGFIQKPYRIRGLVEKLKGVFGEVGG